MRVQKLMLGKPSVAHVCMGNIALCPKTDTGGVIITIIITETCKAPLTWAQRRRTIQCIM